MKKIINLLAIAAVACATVWSCSKAEVAPEENNTKAEVVIKAVLADSQTTKTSVDNSGKVFWESRDSIMVFFGDYAVPFVSYNSEPVDNALFVGTSLVLAGGNENATGSVDGYTYWSVYPMQTRKAHYIPTRDNESVFAYVDPVQVAKAGTFDKSTFVTVARSTDWKQLSFFNLCGGLRFKVSASDIDIVTLKGNNGEKLAGEVNVKMDEQDHPYPAEVHSDRHELQLCAPKGECFKPGVWYYIVSLPANLTKGYTMTFISSASGKMATKTTSAAVEIKRSVFGELDNADSGLSWSEGFDPAELEGMEDLIEITGISFTEDGDRVKLEVVYHNRYIQQLFERIGASFYVGSLSSFNTDKFSYALFSPSLSVENESEYGLRSMLTYEEYMRLEMAANAIYNQIYLAVADSGTEDLSSIKLYRVKGEDAKTVRNGDYLGSSEDGSEHYFRTYSHYSYSIHALTVTADKASVRKVIDYSEALLLHNYDSYWIAGRTFYLSGTYEGRPMIEAFGFDGSYKNATIELEEKYQYQGSRRFEGGIPYIMVEVYEIETGNISTLVYKAVYEPSFGFEKVAVLPGYQRDYRQYNNNVILSTSEAWCFVTKDMVKAFSGRLDWVFWEMIEQYGYLSYVAPVYEDFSAVYVNLNPYTAQLTEKALEIPEYVYDIYVYLSLNSMTFTMVGITNNGYKTTFVNLSTGGLMIVDGRNEPYDFNWMGYWYFDRKYDSLITIDGDFSDWSALEPQTFAQSINNPNSPWGAVKEIRCYAGGNKVYYYIKFDTESLANAFAMDPNDMHLRLCLNTDGEYESGYPNYFLENYDFIIEGTFAEDGAFVEFDGEMYQRIGSWQELLAPGNGLVYGVGKGDEYEISLDRTVFNEAANTSDVPMPMGDTFQTGIRFYYNGWSEFSNVPNSDVDTEQGNGWGYLLRVKFN